MDQTALRGPLSGVDTFKSHAIYFNLKFWMTHSSDVARLLIQSSVWVYASNRPNRCMRNRIMSIAVTKLCELINMWRWYGNYYRISYQWSANEPAAGIAATNFVSLNGFCGYCIAACLVNDCFDSFPPLLAYRRCWMNVQMVRWSSSCGWMDGECYASMQSSAIHRSYF